ncbi:hypothetical protein BKH41_03710 [Helicobacter sp. 12S02232-10]|uniref:hypothetical protein n=1 Tax=Helicobacter sp. 12S02232-10 TaxID=1476197 RepID=UPI000BA64076|nr:hypothetical protein [Helicobacter sp. 12S02232-10]PAF49198.1 hypothetical protein BKH41_03710 [Helicobacter sp. 12S02232-10]
MEEKEPYLSFINPEECELAGIQLNAISFSTKEIMGVDLKNFSPKPKTSIGFRISKFSKKEDKCSVVIIFALRFEDPATKKGMSINTEVMSIIETKGEIEDDHLRLATISSYYYIQPVFTQILAMGGIIGFILPFLDVSKIKKELLSLNNIDSK